MEDAPAPKLAIRANADVPFSIIYEDEHLLVVNKPTGVVTQPGKGHSIDSLLNGLFFKYGKWLHNLGVGRDFGLLHRLDRDTSGLLLIALKPGAYDQLRRDFEERKIEKYYLALVAGRPKPAQGVVQARLKESIADVKKVIVSRSGREAISAYHTLETDLSGKASLMRVNIKTGRLHQIRAHMLFLGTPVLGDNLYTLPAAAALPKPPRLCLHAAHLGFKHPVFNKWMKIDSPFPADLASYARKLGLKAAAPT